MGENSTVPSKLTFTRCRLVFQVRFEVCDGLLDELDSQK